MLSSLSLLTPPITTRWFLVFWCWGRVGWGRVGGRNNVLYRHLYWLAQQFDATLQDLLLHLHSNLTLHYKIFSCTCTATWRYATRSSHALAQQLDATLQDLLMHLHSNLTLRYKIFSCTCTATWRCATRSSLALAQQLDATLQDLFAHLHSNLTLRYKIFSCTCTGQVMEHVKEIVWPAAQTAEKKKWFGMIVMFMINCKELMIEDQSESVPRHHVRRCLS